MHRKVRRPGAALALALLICPAAAASADFSISRSTIDSGGSTRSTGGTFAVGGTIGQPDAGRLSGSGFSLSGGFWLGGGAVTTVGVAPPGDPHAAPFAFRVYPAHPNPAARGTVVAFDLPAQSVVRAALYDVSGRLVRMLADESLPAGRHERAWDRRDGAGQLAPSGVYFLRLEAGAHRSHQKIVVGS